MAIEIGLGVYSFIKYRNFDAPLGAVQQKKMELLVLAHSLTVAVNIGKVCLIGDPTMINVPAALALSKRMIQVLDMEERRNSYVEKSLRNVRELLQKQDELEDIINQIIPETIIIDLERGY